MKGYLLAGIVLASSAQADTRTYICTNADGSKAIQDRACSGSQSFDEARVAKTNAPPPPPPLDFGKATRRIHCSYGQQMRDYYAERNAQQTTPRDRAASNEARRRQQEILDRECAFVAKP